MTPLSEQKLFSIPDVVACTGLSSRSWRRLIAAGAIGIIRIGGVCRIPAEELERFLSERFVPARDLRRVKDPQEIESILDRVVPRRGRPRIVR